MKNTDNKKKKEIKRIVEDQNIGSGEANLIEEPISNADGDQNFTVVNGCTGC